MRRSHHLTHCGLPGINEIPYGLHACHFYGERSALIEALVPYFVAGLRNNERCLWIAAPPLPASEATTAIEAAWSGAREALESGALRIVNFEHWYVRRDALDKTAIVNDWLREEEHALAEGYSGLRITGNTSFLHSSAWKDFMEYERDVSSRFAGRRIVALCSYALGNCTVDQMEEVMRVHACAFDRTDAAWQVRVRHIAADNSPR